jgi:hypothetical protein
MRSQSSSGVSLPAYFGACAGFLLIMVTLSKCSGPNGRAEPNPTTLRNAQLREQFNDGLRQASEDWERQCREEEAQAAADRAQKQAADQSARIELLMRANGMSTEPFVP